jgi:muramoyltetrapeptide carboxypeptidase
MPTIAIIAPSAYMPDPSCAIRAIQRLEQRGWTVKNYVDLNSKHQRFSADDAARLDQLNQAADDPQAQVIMALRGGYGLSRILAQIDFDHMAASGKLFVGFSDFTLFHLGLLAKTGQLSFAGPMLNEDLGSESEQKFTFDQFQQCITQSQYRFSVKAEGNPTLTLQGVFWGGNLTMLTHLIGSPFMPQIQDGILFVEDVNEHPYRIERTLLQLHHAGILARQQALVLGHFTQYKLTDYDNGYDFNAMLTFIRSKIGIPVVTGLPFGHCPNKVTLPVGAQAKFTSNGEQIELEFMGYPYVGNASCIASASCVA